MATEQMRCDGTEMQSILTVMRTHFGWGQVMVSKKVSFFFPNLTCNDNPADIFTKPLAKPKFRRFVDLLGLRPNNEKDGIKDK